MNHHTAAIAIAISMLLVLWFLFDLGPYSTFGFTFVAMPLLFFFVVFYYVREVLRELREKNAL